MENEFIVGKEPSINSIVKRRGVTGQNVDDGGKLHEATMSSKSETNQYYPKKNVEDEIDTNVWFTILRAFILLVVFFVLYGTWRKYILEDSMRDNHYDKLLNTICPNGASTCEYQLKENWKTLLDNQKNRK